MNSDHQIYSAPADLIPAEDEARLDGYLKGREEARLISEERFAQLEAELGKARDARPAP